MFDVQDSGNNLVDDPIDLISSAFVYSLGPGGSTSSGTLVKSGTSSETYTAAAVLAAFTGLGNITLDASTFTQTLLANTGGNTSADQVTSAQLTGTVTYYYEPTAVPEASSVLMVSLVGLGAVGAYYRRRRGS
ncbi:MAG: choice-of-anchor E domain-containing protein [Planctomycetota bacterium]